MPATTPSRKVNCPSCGTATEFSSANPDRPFCSERCRLMDLGDWAAEKFRIPDTTPPDVEDDTFHG